MTSPFTGEPSLRMLIGMPHDRGLTADIVPVPYRMRDQGKAPSKS